MKYYKRKKIYSYLWLISGLLFFVSAILQFKMGDFKLGLLQTFVSFLSILDAYIYGKPYLGLGEGKLVFNNGLTNKEISLRNITSLVENKKRLIIFYNQNTKIKKIKIEVSALIEKEEFIFHIKSELAIKK
jgi:hypothetical protein